MTRRIVGQKLPQEVRAITKQAKDANPLKAIRLLARQQLDGYLSLFGTDGPPINMEALASYRSIRTLAEPPAFSEDAELLPDSERGMLMRVNRERPLTRQRFSIGHEIGHTLFPGYDTQVQCRKSRLRDWHDEKDLLEYLCDVASSEFLFPYEWFLADLDKADISADHLLHLAGRYQASPEATVRRLVDLSSVPTAAIFFRWKLKPSEKSRKPMRNQKSLPGIVGRGSVPKLRVEYPVCNDLFDSLGHHIPAHKSVAEDSVIHHAATSGRCVDSDREFLDLGACSGWFRINAVPLFTQESEQGPTGENGVLAIVQPTSKPRSR